MLKQSFWGPGLILSNHRKKIGCLIKNQKSTVNKAYNCHTSFVHIISDNYCVLSSNIITIDTDLKMSHQMAQLHQGRQKQPLQSPYHLHLLQAHCR